MEGLEERLALDDPPPAPAADLEARLALDEQPVEGPDGLEERLALEPRTMAPNTDLAAVEQAAVEQVGAEAEPVEVAEAEPVEVAEAEPVEVAEAEPVGAVGWGHRSLVSAIVIVAVVLMAIVILVISARDKPPQSANHVGQPLAVNGRADSFDRPDDPASLTGPASFLWTVGAGTFGVAGNQAFAAPETTTRSMAVVNLGQPDGGATVRVSKVRSNAGLVFRFHDAANYWAVVAIREYASWAILHVVNGRQVVVANTGLSATSDGTMVGVRLRAGVVDIALNGTVVRTITDPTLKSATGIGITAMGPGPEVALFDDFTATVR